MTSILHRSFALLRGSKAGLTDTAVTMGGQGGTAIIGVFASILLARSLSARDFGTYALVTSVVAFANGLTDMGIAQTAIRFGARATKDGDEDGLRAVIRWAASRRIMFACVVAVTLAMLGPRLAMVAWAAQDSASLIPLALLITLATQLGANVPLFLQATGRFGGNSVAQTVTAVSSLAGLLTVVALQSLSVRSVIVASAVATLGSSILNQLLIPREARLWSRAASPPVPGDLVPFARMMLVTSITTQLMLSADVWILGAAVRPEQVAIYSIAVRFTLPLSLAVGAVGAVIWPRISAAVGDDETQAMGGRLLRIVALGAAPIVAYSLAAPLIAPALFGAQYRASIPVAQVLCLRYTIAILGTVIITAGYNLGMGRFYPVMNVGRILVLGLAGMFLAPSLGPLAMAIGMLLSEGVFVFGAAYLIRRRLRLVSHLGASSA